MCVISYSSSSNNDHHLQRVVRESQNEDGIGNGAEEVEAEAVAQVVQRDDAGITHLHFLDHRICDIL